MVALYALGICMRSVTATAAFSDILISVYMKCGRIDMFLFLFIFVTKMSFCFHTIEIKSCKKNLHKDVPHDPTFQSRTEPSPPVGKTKASDSKHTFISGWTQTHVR